MPKKSALIDRLLDNISPEPNSGCWLWSGGFWSGELQRGGPRGFVRRSSDIKGQRGQQMIAHRAAWEVFCGHVPEGMLVLHKCDVSLCINPAHLYIGTQKDNVRDCIERRRFRPRGKNPWDKAA